MTAQECLNEETGEITGIPDATLNCDNALLSPEGRIYPTPGFAYHSEMAKRIVKHLGMTADPVVGCHQTLLRLGWAKLRTDCGVSEWWCESANGWQIDNGRMTQKQLDVIFDWCMKNGQELPDFLKPKEDSELVNA